MGAFAGDAAPDDHTALDTALDAALADFRELPRVIVDATNNRGGYDAVSLHIASLCRAPHKGLQQAGGRREGGSPAVAHRAVTTRPLSGAGHVADQ